jgi:hypothetical protein
MLDLSGGVCCETIWYHPPGDVRIFDVSDSLLKCDTSHGVALTLAASTRVCAACVWLEYF